MASHQQQQGDQQDFFGGDEMSANLPSIDRQAGLAHLNGFAPFAGKSYAQFRNFDRGRDQHRAISRLSAHLRRRIITEEEVLKAVLSYHSPAACEKFILEVYWRGYFTGWLANRPQIWDEFLDYQMDESQHIAYHKAIDGKSGIACFDSWVDELKQTHYLHNHARMWFASIWIFTLGLDWEAGAAFFARYLRDFCPASNTLGWRWVAGLHTHGKHYLAKADNIARFTDNRFNPAGQLNEHAAPIAGVAHPPAQFAFEQAQIGASPYLLLATAEDCHLQSLSLPHPPAAIISLPDKMGDSSWLAGRPAMRSEPMLMLDRQAISQTAEEASQYFGCPHHDLTRCADGNALASQIAVIADGCQAQQIIAAYQGVGFWQSHLEALSALMPAHQIGYVMRDYDRLAIQAATKGFFAFKAHIPQWLGMLLATKT